MKPIEAWAFKAGNGDWQVDRRWSEASQKCFAGDVPIPVLIVPREAVREAWQIKADDGVVYSVFTEQASQTVAALYGGTPRRIGIVELEGE